MEPNNHLPEHPSPLSPRERAALGLPSKTDPNYLFRLKSIRMEVERLLVEFEGDTNDPWERPWATCKRCGFKWQPMRIFPSPRQCARCHSSYWMSEPIYTNSRRPSDLPNPKWLAPKKRRKSKVEVITPTHPLMGTTLPASRVGLRALTPPPSITKNNGQDLYRFMTTLTPPSPLAPSPLAPHQPSEAPSDPGVVQSGRTPLSSAPPVEASEDVEEIEGSNPSTGEAEVGMHTSHPLEEDQDYISGSDL